MSDLATLAGWGTFRAEYAIYWFVLGAMWGARGFTVDRVCSSAEVHA